LNQFKGTVSRDWEGLLMVEIDKTHLFSSAGEGLFLNLSAFSYRTVKKQYEPALHFDSAVLKISTCRGMPQSRGL